MGNASKKLAAKCALLTKDEQKHVASTFRAASKKSGKIREDDLIVSGTLDPDSLDKFWGPQIDPRLAQYLSNFLFGWGPNKSPTCDFDRFAELYVYNVRGSIDERMTLTYNCLGKEFNENEELPFQLLKEYCESIASTYVKILKASSSRRAKTWISKGFRGRPQHVQGLGEALAATIGADDDSPSHHVKSTQVSRWLQTDTLLMKLSECVFLTLYGVSKRPTEGEGQSDSPTTTVLPMPNLLPVPEGLSSMPDYPAFIDLSHIVWLNQHIPRKHQHKWRFLFSSHIHGESFSTMAGRIQEQGASILIIEDSSGYIFGGFAPQSWALGPNFFGSEESFLFTLSPKMRMYPSSGYNNHYQYINQHTKTFPNGLLMGGQLEFGGIWIVADPFGTGSSAESCSTYRGYKRLTKDAEFKIRSLEVWGVGDKPLTVKESGERDTSVLDRNPDANAILEMAGKTRHSEGLREPTDH